MESQRQKKISSLLQKEVAELISSDLRRGGSKNLIISVTRARVSSDLSLCKVYLSIFPSDGAQEQLALIKLNAPKIKHDLSRVLKNHLRKVPSLLFLLMILLTILTQWKTLLKIQTIQLKGNV